MRRASALRREGEPAPVIHLVEEKLTVLVAPDDDQYTAYCPDLDLAVAADSPEGALDDLLQVMQDYAKDHLDELARFSHSPNRAHHLPYVKAISRSRSAGELRQLVAVRYGTVELSVVPVRSAQ